MAVSKTRDGFVEKFCEDFVCSVCLCIPFPDHAIEATCCGNFFCYPCLKGCREKKEICPNCNGKFSEFVPRTVRDGNKFALKKLLGLIVYCDTRFVEDETPDGSTPIQDGEPTKCDWEGSWGDMADHLRRCDYVNVPCLWNNCPRILPRREIEEHEKSCNYRTVFCAYCNSAFPHNVLEEHHSSECTNYPVDCECETKGLTRSTLFSHRTFNCPFSSLPCEINGCTEKVYRKDVEEHRRNCSFREVNCNFCEKLLPFNQLQEHHDRVCDCVLIACPNDCGSDKMQRKQLNTHQAICPTYPVTCLFAGCAMKVERCKLEGHMQEAMAHHFQILYKQVTTLQSTVTTLSSAVSAGRDQIDNLTKVIEQKDKTISELNKKVSVFERGMITLTTSAESLTTRCNSMEATIKTAKATSVSYMIHGPFYISLQYGVGTASFFSSDIEWLVNIRQATKGPAFYVGLKDSKNGCTGAKISFTLTVFPVAGFLDRTVVTSTSKLEISKSHTAGIYIDAMMYPHAGLYKLAIADFRVEEFIW